MYVAKVPNRNSPPTYLIRHDKRVNGKVVKTTLANITKLPGEIIESIRTLLKGGTVVKSVQEAFTIRSNMPHGHVAAVLGIMNQLRLRWRSPPGSVRVIVHTISAPCELPTYIFWPFST